MKQKDKNKVWPIFLLVVVNIIIWSVPASVDRGILSVSFLDVGQGDSIFIQAPNGKQLLIDGGPNSSVLRELGKIMDFSDKDIDVVLATHPDKDHIGGLPEVFDRFNIYNYLEPNVSEDTNIYVELKDRVGDEGSRLINAVRGVVVVLDRDNGVYFQILSPADNFRLEEKNEMSVVGRLVYKDRVFLLTGDAGKFVENILSYEDGEFLNSDVLKVGHHGSRTSSSLLFLENVSPGFSVISASSNNTYGHPHDDVLKNLKSVNSDILETSKEGTITFQTDGIDIWIN